MMSFKGLRGLTGCCFGGHHLDAWNNSGISHADLVANFDQLDTSEEHIYDNNIHVSISRNDDADLAVPEIHEIHSNSYHDKEEHIYDNNISLNKSSFFDNIYHIDNCNHNVNDVKNILPCKPNEYVRPGFALKTWKKRSSRKVSEVPESDDCPMVTGILYRRSTGEEFFNRVNNHVPDIASKPEGHGNLSIISGGECFDNTRSNNDNTETRNGLPHRKESKTKWWKLSTKSCRRHSRRSSYNLKTCAQHGTVSEQNDGISGTYTAEKTSEEIDLEWDMVDDIFAEIQSTCDSLHNLESSTCNVVNSACNDKNFNFNVENSICNVEKSSDFVVEDEGNGFSYNPHANKTHAQITGKNLLYENNSNLPESNNRHLEYKGSNSYSENQELKGDNFDFDFHFDLNIDRDMFLDDYLDGGRCLKSAESEFLFDHSDLMESKSINSESDVTDDSDFDLCHEMLGLSYTEGTQDGQVLLRRKKSPSPQTERPKSEAGVRWADLDLDASEFHQPVRLRRHAQMFKDRPRPKSDLDDSIQLFDELFDEILEDFDTEGSSFLSERMKAFGSEIDLQPYCSLRNLYDMRKRDFDKRKNRRMSTPHPIKSRLHRSPKKLQKQPPLVRSSSMPESLDKITKRRKLHLLDYHMDSLQRHMDAEDCLSDDSDLSFDHASLQERSLSIQSSQSQLTSMDEDEDNLIYAEALWDHITMVPDEIAFRAQDVIEVMDMRDKDWWYGAIDDKEGWFPAAFVRLRVNQDQIEEEDMEITLHETLTSSPKSRRISMLNKNQARTNVVNEIINAEREYVKHLKDVVEGYIQHARKRKEMFPEERIALIFGNIETIYSFAQKFLGHLEKCIDVCPHLSEIGQCFLDNERGFEVYSDYCNNHPSACEELKELCLDSKYRHFFEACRLLQELVEIPLEGFLLTPVQKICKYPLQLAELLKYTPPDHPDYVMVKDALSAMRKIATLINERKRKMESIEKIAAWQHTVVDWEGDDLLERSSELIFSGDINKVNTAGWSQERYFFLFDHQLIYCKKELLKRHVFSYKGRIDLDQCEVIDVPDGRDTQYNVSVKHGWKLHETHKDKWYLLYGKTLAVKERWLKALKDERKRVKEDRDNDFCVPDHWKQTVLNKVRSQSNLKDKHPTNRVNPAHQVPYQKDLKDFTYSTLPRRRLNSQKQDKKKGWFIFGGKKSKR